MDGNSRMSKNEKGEENKDRNSGRCPETRELVKTEEKEEVEEIEEESVSVAQCIPSSSETQQSDMDGWPFGKANCIILPRDTNDGITSQKIVRIDIDPNAENYNMYHKRRGVALIFNNISFTNRMTVRQGSEKDCNDLTKSLKNLDFEVRIYKDPTLKTISTILQESETIGDGDGNGGGGGGGGWWWWMVVVDDGGGSSGTAAEDHTDADCLIVTVMSHGESTLLHSADSLYSADMLWTPFTADQCPTLAGKPKLFFIQNRLDRRGMDADLAGPFTGSYLEKVDRKTRVHRMVYLSSPAACRGNQLDHGVTVLQGGDVTDSRTDFYTIPVFSDIMVAYSTLSGFYSWRNPDNGSWFIQAICEEFNIHGRTLDLLTLMTFVNRRVAINYQSFVPQRKSFHQKKQIPTIVSMLTRIVYFPKKSILRSKSVLHSSTEENKTSNIKNNAYGATPC
ncbi:caspase-1-like [Vespula maculifrons]|uniref:Caspase-1-like n=1 Tax=Vespula maculifrons TaxID=7453 RepID=A0ABD2CVL0_VESMC